MTAASSDRRERYYRDRVAAETDRFPEKDPLSVSVLLNLLHTYDISEHLLARELQAYDLSPSAFNVLLILRHHGPSGCPMSVVSELMIVSRANITGLVDALESRGLVTRTQSESDRRCRTAAITRAGTTLLNRILPGHYRYIRETMSCLNDAEKQRLCELLCKLRTGCLRLS